MTQTAEAPPKPVSKTAWKKAKVHEGVTLPSGTVVSITLPNLPRMIKAGELPNALLDQALGANAAAKEEGKVTKEMLEQAWEYTEFIVPLTVVEPKIETTDVGDLPTQDLEMIAAFASRVRDMDAVGHQLGGLETVKAFRRVRGIYDLDEILEDS